ncbi:Cu+-exporting ATPase [Saccharicrinis carchari]|uniref:Cu+-exporting ATPase n=1 Tax=Saccharicrinis carchari TaxID=1168039 RepID=A0A521CKQ0_SACCC|nr:heavy metal translocating P-type ATPase metal-binding domain-containing protein [Saccharicrinis carchari]SMO60014.1 Cu+-exporting ATPase [Saccharicrinis carchari]
MSNKCVHCGADCGKYPVIQNEQKFCCNGCATVYLLLNDSNMQRYYEFQKQPGIRLEEAPHLSKYAYLDKEEVRDKLYEFFEDGIAKVTFYIPSIHCASCIWLLEHLSKLNKGVKHAAVNFVQKKYTVSFDTRIISLRQLVELLVSIHYVPDISLQNLDGRQDKKGQNKGLLYKIGVAGFVFGNVMLYSLPEYFNGETIEGSFGTFLYYLMYVLTIPLVFYSGSDYLLSAGKNIVKGIVNIDLPIAIGILALFFVTSYEVLMGIGPGYSDSLSGFLFFLLLGRWYQSKTYQALAFDRDYKSYFPVAVTRLNGQEESVLLEEVKEGDYLLIRNKELIPADSSLVDGTALVDYSFVTGESAPVRKSKDDFLYAGGVQTGGAITVKVVKEVAQSHLTQLWNQSEKNTLNAKSLTSAVDKISGKFTLAVIIIALAAFGTWLYFDTFKTALLVLTSVLIVACPCALALSIPFTLGSAMRIFGHKGLYVKNTNVIERMTKIDTLVFDKTGTLTKPEESSVSFVGLPLQAADLAKAVSLAQQSTHPLSAAITKFYKDIKTYKTVGFTEVPGRGVFAMVDNVPVKLGALEYLNDEGTKPFKPVASAVYLSIDNKILGYFKISNQYRQGVEDVLAKLKDKYALYLLSGDNDAERENLIKLFGSEQMLFNQKPQDKMNFIADLQGQGKSVLMTGDGLNDSGAFMSSDVALSLADDIYHFSPAGDAILEASKFKRFHQYIHFAKKSMTIVKQSFIISFFYNTIGLGFAITGNLSPVVAAILMPVSSITVVAFTTFATRLAGSRILK